MQSSLKLLLCLLLASSGLARAATESAGELRCRSERIGPFVDFELRFVAGAWISLPLKQFWGKPLGLTLSMHVEPVNGTPGKAISVTSELKSDREVPEGYRGSFTIPSAVSVGEGEYRSTWSIGNSDGRTCTGSRQFKAARKGDLRSVNLTLKPGEIVETSVYMFRKQESFERPQLQSSKRLKVFLSLDVLGRRGRVTRTRLFHVMPHIAALRRLANSPNFNQFSLVAFSFEDQRVLVKQEYRETVDFSALANVVSDLRPETVDISQLRRGSEMQFFEGLLLDELLRADPPDTVVFLGQDLNFGKKLPSNVLERFRSLNITTFFLDASRFAWRGAMGNLVHALNGKEMRLRDPRDLVRAISLVESSVLRSRPQ